MKCPNVECEGISLERYKSPVEVPGLGIVRRHRCPNCRKISMSLQKLISNWAAEKILLRLEERDALSSEPPTASSGITLETDLSSGTRTPES
jgi:hypothetical protein